MVLLVAITVSCNGGGSMVLMTIKQYCLATGLSRRTFYRWIGKDRFTLLEAPDRNKHYLLVEDPKKLPKLYSKVKFKQV